MKFDLNLWRAGNLRRIGAVMLAFALALAVFGGLSQSASAAGTFTVVTPNNPDGWHADNVRANATVGITTAQPRGDAPNNLGSLEFTTNTLVNGQDKADYVKYWGVVSGRTLGNLNELSYEFYRASSSTTGQHYVPALRLAYLTPSGDTGLLIWENVYNGGSTATPAPTDQWIMKDILGGNFWMRTFNPGFTVEHYDVTLAQWQSGVSFPGSDVLGPDTNIVGIETGVGSGWGGTFTGFVDNVAAGFGNDSMTANFEPDAVVVQCTTTCYVDANSGSDANGGASAGDAKKTIQAAVNQVSPNGKVVIAAGNYPEQVTINKDGLTIQGAGKTTTTIQGSSCTGNGITLAGSHNGLTIADLSVTGFENGVYLGVIGDTQTNITIEDVNASDNCRHGIISQDGVITNLTINRVTASHNGFPNSNTTGSPGRGIWIINGVKSNISITNSTVSNNWLTGIDFGDGNVTGLAITGNTVEGNGDAGISVLGAKGPGANLVDSNTVRNNGRYGIEVKASTGNGNDSGGGSLVVSRNIVERTVAATDVRDYAGIAVIRRSGQAAFNDDQPSGAVVSNNEVRGYHRKPAGSTGDGFGIVVEGLNNTVKNNIVTDNDVGIQVQGGNTANTQSTDFFDRGDAAQGGAVVNLNSIVGNDIGLRVSGTANATVLNAERNWWGSASGPSNAGNPSGSGDSVAGNADFDPWLCSGQDTSTATGFQPNPQTSPCTPPTGALTVTKYNDLDGNGAQGASEPGLSGWSIAAKQGLMTIANGTTDGTGKVTFPSLPAGSYTVCETLKSGWQNTDPSDGSGCKTTQVSANTTATVLLGNKLVPPVGPAPAQPGKIYAVNDAGLSDSQFFTIGADSAHTVTKLGPLYKNYDLEALDIQPGTGRIYATAGGDNKAGKRGWLFQVDGVTGALTPIGSTSQKEVEAIAFKPNGELWGWGIGKGLIKINLATGASTLVLKDSKDIEGLAWSNDGSTLYASAGKKLYVYDQVKNKMVEIASNLPGSTEALDMRPDGLLALGVDGKNTIYAYDVGTKKVIAAQNISAKPFDDVEGISWPIASS